MKFLLLLISFLLCCMNSLQAQTPSTYDNNGKVKSVETRRYEESRNKQNNSTPASAPASGSKSTPKTNTAPTSNSGYYNADVMEAERLRKIKEAAAKEAFIKKVAKYDEVDLGAYRSEGNYVRVKSGGKYGFVDITGEEVIPLVYDELAPYYMGDGFKARIGKKWGFINHCCPVKKYLKGGFYAFFFD